MAPAGFSRGGQKVGAFLVPAERERDCREFFDDAHLDVGDRGAEPDVSASPFDHRRGSLWLTLLAGERRPGDEGEAADEIERRLLGAARGVERGESAVQVTSQATQVGDDGVQPSREMRIVGAARQCQHVVVGEVESDGELTVLTLRQGIENGVLPFEDRKLVKFGNDRPPGGQRTGTVATELGNDGEIAANRSAEVIEALLFGETEGVGAELLGDRRRSPHRQEVSDHDRPIRAPRSITSCDRGRDLVPVELATLSVCVAFRHGPQHRAFDDGILDIGEQLDGLGQQLQRPARVLRGILPCEVRQGVGPIPIGRGDGQRQRTADEIVHQLDCTVRSMPGSTSRSRRSAAGGSSPSSHSTAARRLSRSMS